MTETTSNEADVRDGMLIEWDVPITMSDGTVLRADVFRPVDGTPAPVIMSYGCYAKGLPFQQNYKNQWDRMVTDFPEIVEDTTNKYQCWEVADPERWVPHGYAVVRVDSRGAGTSPGIQDVWSAPEIDDYAECIEWAGTQPWSTGKVGLLGISYYGANQWLVAGKQPQHLAAIVPWEGTSDWYREVFYHGGIRSGFLGQWLPKQAAMQHGYGDRGTKNPNTGEWIAGPETLTDEELAANKVDKVAEVASKPFAPDYTDIAPQFDKITVPILSAANWGGQGLHLRGNFEGYLNAAADQKWLSVHGMEHWSHFYTGYGVDLQRRFLDHFLLGKDNGWDNQPKVTMLVRHVDPGDKGSIAGRFERHYADAWPLPETRWTTWNLDADRTTLSTDTPNSEASVSYDTTGTGVTFLGPVAETETEVTGPLAAKLFVSSTTTDADLFLVLRVIDPDGDEVVFRGAMDAHTPTAQGWLRVSHRALDEEKSLPHRPYHTHTSAEPMTPGEIYEVAVEIWPTSVVIPAGYRLALTVRGNDYRFEGEPASNSSHRYPSMGVGPFTHNDPQDRPADIFDATVTVHTGPDHQSQLLLPVIPTRKN